MEKQYCNQCSNRCPVDALQCGRGRRQFGGEEAGATGAGGPPHGREMPAGPIGLLRQCGHLLHHGGVAGEDLLSGLTAAEQAELERLLTALLADWKARMPEAPEGRHGHH